MHLRAEIGLQSRWVQIAGMLVIAVLVGVLVWLLLIREGGSGSAPEAGAGPVVASESDLAALADELGHPVYWAGSEDGAELEVTRTEQGQVYVRYLTDGAQPGDPGTGFLTVGTYPLADATATLDKLVDKRGALTSETPGGELVVTNEDNASSVYTIDPDGNLQIEVYDPDPEQAFTLATSRAIVPVQ